MISVKPSFTSSSLLLCVDVVTSFDEHALLLNLLIKSSSLFAGGFLPVGVPVSGASPPVALILTLLPPSTVLSTLCLPSMSLSRFRRPLCSLLKARAHMAIFESMVTQNFLAADVVELDDEDGGRRVEDKVHVIL